MDIFIWTTCQACQTSDETAEVLTEHFGLEVVRPIRLHQMSSVSDFGRNVRSLDCTSGSWSSLTHPFELDVLSVRLRTKRPKYECTHRTCHRLTHLAGSDDQHFRLRTSRLKYVSALWTVTSWAHIFGSDAQTARQTSDVSSEVCLCTVAFREFMDTFIWIRCTARQTSDVSSEV
jgi:hypothetical protein